jgi:3-methyladenine DNA glycosylase AlkD
VYTETVIDDKEHCMKVMLGMEEAFRNKDEDYFIEVLKKERSLVLRVHAVCILAEIGGEKAVATLCDILLNDPDPLVRHEAAFSLGQIGSSSAIAALEDAVLKDKDPIVRHEAAAALGSIGSAESEKTLVKALEDKEDIVRNSARASLFNIQFLKEYFPGSEARERAPRP